MCLASRDVLSGLQPRLNKTSLQQGQSTCLASVPEPLPWNYGILGNRILSPLGGKRQDEDFEDFQVDCERYLGHNCNLPRCASRNFYLDL